MKTLRFKIDNHAVSLILRERSTTKTLVNKRKSWLFDISPHYVNDKKIMTQYIHSVRYYYDIRMGLWVV